jgi:hypothetical protein
MGASVRARLLKLAKKRNQPNDLLLTRYALERDDGVVFGVAGLAVDLIREELEYGGLRIKTDAEIAGARVRVVIDIGLATRSSRMAPRWSCPCCSISRRRVCAPIRARL